MGAMRSSASGYEELTSSWQRENPLPVSRPERLVLALGSLRGLREVRTQVRAFLITSAGEGDPVRREDVVETAVLVIDELTSNALRHGAPPCSLHVGDEPAAWTVAVTDGAPYRLPTPARDRPAGAGGYGLYMIAGVASDYGVHYDEATKTVWATLAKPA